MLVALVPEVLRRGLEALLDEIPRVSARFSAANPAETISMLRPHRVDVLLFAVTPTTPAAQLVGFAREAGVKTLVVIPAAGEELLECAARLPADGFVMADELDERSLEDALDELARGEMPVPVALGRLALTKLRQTTEPIPVPALTRREWQTLRLLARGLSNKEIAAELAITEHGAKRHVGRVLAKLNCPNRTTAVTTAHQLGLVPHVL